MLAGQKRSRFYFPPNGFDSHWPYEANEKFGACNEYFPTHFWETRVTCSLDFTDILSYFLCMVADLVIPPSATTKTHLVQQAWK